MKRVDRDPVAFEFAAEYGGIEYLDEEQQSGLELLVSEAFDALEADGTFRPLANYDPKAKEDDIEAAWLLKKWDQDCVDDVEREKNGPWARLFEEELPYVPAAEDHRPSKPYWAPTRPELYWPFDGFSSVEELEDKFHHDLLEVLSSKISGRRHYKALKAEKARYKARKEKDGLAVLRGPKNIDDEWDEDGKTIAEKIGEVGSYYDEQIGENRAQIIRIAYRNDEELIVVRTDYEIEYAEAQIVKKKEEALERARLGFLRKTGYAGDIGSTTTKKDEERAIRTLKYDSGVRKARRPYNPNRSHGWNDKPANDRPRNFWD